MGLFKISGVEVKGICSSVPKKKVANIDSSLLSSSEKERVISAIGISERRISNSQTCTSDLCFDAAQDLIAKLNWKKENIDVLVVVTQSADYIMPATACILQDRLGLSKRCLAFDVNLGCSGYVYGLSIVSSIMNAAGLKQGLLLVGDTLSKVASPEDRSVSILFGDAGTATALENTGWGTHYYNLNTDGGGKDAIIIPAGGSRRQVSSEDFEFIDHAEGVRRRAIDLAMDGVGVFNFTIREVVKNIDELLSANSLDRDHVDSFVFHQANKMINDLLSKRLKVEKTKIPSSLYHYGNTSSATIPLTICSQMKSDFFEGQKRLLLSGFGVGLSWGSVVLDIKDQVVLNLREWE